ncbi:ABC-three component system protein [Actinoallomurus sp. CA-150999]|uniref:ABC-three component system protein n=1 Tax=Actinoallomurus sp. CA-150999 TaxID=3239887 RepID=UPI003D8ACD3D
METHDDVGWESATTGDPVELLQTKHHLVESVGLGDKDSDIWKTLLVWMDTAYPTDPQGPRLILVTTSVAEPGTAAYALRSETRDESTALFKLTEAASNSSAKATEKARATFLKLSDADRMIFLSRVAIADGAVRSEGLEEELRVALWASLPSDHQDLFLSLVWKWWARTALRMLQGEKKSVSAVEAQQSISNIRDGFTAGRLPTLVDLADVDEGVVVAAHHDEKFVHQLRWVECGETNLRKAVVDYYRAYTQVHRWLTEDLIASPELDKFEDNLKDEWQRVFADMQEDLGEDADERVKVKAGRRLLRQLRDSTNVTVRSGYDDLFFARGRRHALADRGLIGWHPDFEHRLETLMLGAVTSSGTAER